MNGFYISVKNELLEPKHIKAMGGNRNVGTIWLFLWLLDKMTIIDHEKGEGKVLGGKPIRYEDIKADLGISRATYKRWLDMLREGNYIKTTRTPYGLVIVVYKAFKVFNQRSVMKEPSAQGRRLNNEPSMSRIRAISKSGYEPSNIRQDSRQYKDYGDFKKKKEDHRGEFSQAKEVLRKRWGKKNLH